MDTNLQKKIDIEALEISLDHSGKIGNSNYNFILLSGFDLQCDFVFLCH